jgi:hypothetical protein
MKALNLRRGVRRLLLVLSVAWAGASAFYLWRFPPQPEHGPWEDYQAAGPRTAKPTVYLDENGNPLPPGFKPLPPLPPGFKLDSPAAASPALPSIDEMLASGGKPQAKPAPPTTTTFDADLAAAAAKNALDATLVQEEAKSERQKRAWLRCWLEIGFLPPLAAFALLEGLFWAARGFSESKPTNDHNHAAR